MIFSLNKQFLWIIWLSKNINVQKIKICLFFDKIWPCMQQKVIKVYIGNSTTTNYIYYMILDLDSSQPLFLLDVWPTHITQECHNGWPSPSLHFNKNVRNQNYLFILKLKYWSKLYFYCSYTSYSMTKLIRL